MARSARSLEVEAAFFRFTEKSFKWTIEKFEEQLININRGLDLKGIPPDPDATRHSRFYLAYCYDYFARNFEQFSTHTCTDICRQISLQTKTPCRVLCAVTYLNAALYDVCNALGIRADSFHLDTFMIERQLESFDACRTRMRNSTPAVREAMLQRLVEQLAVLVQLRMEFEGPDPNSRGECSGMLESCTKLFGDLVSESLTPPSC